MIKALKFITLLGVLFAVYSCKNESESKPNINDNESEEIIDEMYKETADPPKAAAIKQGEVVFGADTFEVIEEETDNISIVSQFTNGDNGQEMTTTKYREKVFYLISKKTNDTVTIQKQMFKSYSNQGDFSQLLLQSVAFDVEAKNGNVPLLVSLCKPDSDVCDDYSVTVQNGKFVIEEVDLGEMGE